ncbi:MAG: phosphoenolpyruvate carboxykinase (GTP) [Clostridia bacterium]|nr:phosphoenolpyruvate carboxykinase (GTP) [Clostridia bacterium]
MTNNKAVLSWLEEMKALTNPDQIVWYTGAEDQKAELRKQAVAEGTLIELNQEKLPGCYLHRTKENDVARVEDRTFICTTNKEDAGPINNWMAPAEAYKMMKDLYRDSMKGRTMYVVPFIMGVPGSPFAKVGIELTDSIYVVLNMDIMTRAGDVALEELGDSADFTKCLHASKDINADDRYIIHFPEDNTIWSINSNYGGNVLLGKKCLALRIASYLGKQEGWMAEHMLILGLENPQGEKHYIAAAFPSACGKTNLAMLIPPLKGYKVTTVGDDIAWLRVGEDGRLWAVNPEAGFFGVAPGTSSKTNKNALETTMKNTIFTNVALKPDGTVWWEGADGEVPETCIDWKGNPWTAEMGKQGIKAAHPNSRFTAPAAQCPCIAPEFNSKEGVPISAIVFGGRRAKTAPLVYQSFNWQHGVFVGATMASETTAAAAGAVGVIRRDPMAMRPFAGYHMGDYFNHWLEMGKKIPNPPKIFHVNWFKQNDEGKFIWPGFGDNLRVLNWILDRCDGKVDAVETAIGYLPKAEDLDVSGLDLSDEVMAELLSVDKEAWLADVENQKEFFAPLGDRMPAELKEEQAKLEERLSK